ncbi:MAG TPA: efflux RND transporter periplasmic adaptor subunit [Terracidiphilus sp.]|jgi:cobalt-zinc-cadmium efflux system membrane fusion protein|nr:efflux RND transporter periplasmic adaptor subunit [Terracidiphilus sp.]
MKNQVAGTGLAMAVCLLMGACGKKFDPASGAVTSAQVLQASNSDLVAIDRPQQFPLVTAARIDVPEILNVTGAVFPDIAREVPVISLANGRVVDIRTRLDDDVTKGQLLFSVQSPDITSAFDTYVKSVSDEQMANKAYLRAQELYKHGAIAQAMLEQEEDAERDAKADEDAAEQQLKIFGVDKNHPSTVVNVFAPISGVIIAQNVTNAAAAGVALSGNATAFTIADLSKVWVLCDVYENDLPKVGIGQEAEIRLPAYPDKLLKGRISDIGPVLDPTIRTAKVRIEVANPKILRLGMYVTATLTSRTKSAHAAIPASAILHMHDRDWVFVPAGQGHFKRVEIAAGVTLPDGRQVILSGIAPEQQVVANVLSLEETLEAQ